MKYRFVIAAVGSLCGIVVWVPSAARPAAAPTDGLRAFVANEASDTISVIDTAELRRLQNISLLDGLLPMRAAVSPAGTLLYVNTGRRLAHGLR